MKIFRLMMFGFLLFPALGWADQGVRILLPNDHVSTAYPYIHIVGSSDFPDVVVELNGKEIASLPVLDSIFHSRITLPFGLNHVVIKPRGIGAEDFESAARIEILCGPRIPKSYSKLFVPHEFHADDSPQPCISCHAKDRFEEISRPNQNWCESCHMLTGNQFKKHVDSDRGDCTGCHPIADDLTLTVTGEFSDINPCFSCHVDKIGQYAQDFIHGPVAGGSCTVCHNPHGSTYENNLRSPVPFLCMSCHVTEEAGKARVGHKPFSDGRCTACHDPHSTNNRWVLVKESGAVCLSCHEGGLTNHQHRYEVKPRQNLETDLALNEEGRLECLTCHWPHSGESDHLLKTDADNPCIGCHPRHL